jgi:uroporphyrinogen-III synthase
MKAGYQAVNWPLIEISPIKPDQQFLNILSRLETFSAVVFVSSAAVEHFMNAVQKLSNTSWPAVKCWATGQGTLNTLIRWGVAEHLIMAPDHFAPQFDSPHLWERVKNTVNASDKVLFVKGSDENLPPSPLFKDDLNPPSGSNWLIWKLQESNIHVDTIEVYTRGTPQWSAEQISLASKAINEQAIWIFSSSLAIENLSNLLPNQDWSKGSALATHSKIASKAKEVGWGVVHVSRPVIADVLKSLKFINPF